jgi:hypothetical protein
MQVKSMLHTKPAIMVCIAALFFIVKPLSSFGQTIQTGSIHYLQVANGFKGITLGSDVGTMPANLSYLDGDSKVDADSCIKYAYGDQTILKMDTSLKLDLVGLRTYKNKVVNIYLFFDVKDAYKVLANFLRLYGQYTDKPDEYANLYNWSAGDVALSLKYNADVDKGVAIFSYKPLVKEIAERRVKREKMEQIIASINPYASSATNIP